jgi:crotonobetainyl-CoA:carnitine CoA-transferase CaiB-like acyl-CoA transferase
MAELVPMISALTTSEVIDALEGVGVPVGAVLDIGQVLDSPETQQRHMISEFHRADAGTVRTANSPWKIDGHAPRASRPAPTLGQHTQEVLRGLAATGREEVGH